MKRPWATVYSAWIIWGLIAGTIAVILQQTVLAGNPALTSFVIQHRSSLRFQKIAMPQGIAYVLTIPATARYEVRPAVRKDGLAELPELSGKAAAAVNGGFFDPANGKTTSYVTIDGELAADPRQNERLGDNENLAPYLEKIMNRSEFRLLDCEDGRRYDITPHHAKPPEGCEIRHALGAGPMLLPTERSLTDQMIEEAVVDYDDTGRLIRDPLGVNRPNARTAVGLTAKGDVILMMLAQNPADTEARGFTLADTANLLRGLGAKKALSLDGGSSSAMMAEGTVYYGKFTPGGEPVRRRIKSALVVLPEQIH